MLAHIITELSTSDWAVPIVLVKKKDGSLRLCVDYRRLNSVSKADAYPMLRIDELIDQLGRSQYPSMPDLTGLLASPHQCGCPTEDGIYHPPFGLFQFRRTPFVWQGALATFQRVMDKLLDRLGDFVKAAVDFFFFFLVVGGG